MDGAAEGVEMTYYNGNCTTVQEFCQTFGLTWKEGETCLGKEEEDIPFNTLYRRVSPSEDYYNRVALGVTYNYQGDQYTWENFGPLKWELVLCLLATWVLVGLSLFKGVSSLGKAAYVITLSPYFILTALLAYAAPRSVSYITLHSLPLQSDFLGGQGWNSGVPYLQI